MQVWGDENILIMMTHVFKVVRKRSMVVNFLSSYGELILGKARGQFRTVCMLF